MLQRLALVTLVATLGTAASAANSPFRQLYDLNDLPLLKTGVQTYQVSSHDPTGGNGDAGHFVRISGNVKVLADLKGPGIVRRIWSANPSGRLRIVVDGAPRPAVDAPFTDLFEDKVPGFRSPVAGKSSGGWYSYVPISFQKSCLITATDAGWFYYQVTWQKLPSGTTVSPSQGRLSAADQTAYASAITAWSSLGKTPAEPKAIQLPKRFISLPPGGRWAQPIKGPGTVTALRFAFASDMPFSTLRQTILRISFDGGKPAVEAPLGDFFGIGFDDVQWKSLALGHDEDGGYCYFRMPFQRAARIELENQSKGSFQAAFSGSARAGVPAEPWGYFHANYHSAINAAGRDYLFGKLRGSGHVVGVTESMRGNGSQWFLEGDEKVYVDGGAEPDIYGTGTEDFYNCGWYFNTGLVDVATHGLSHKTDNEIGAWRLLVPDPIPFTRALDFHIEHGGTNDVAGSEYSSVIYWYGASGSRDILGPMPRGSALLPKPYLPTVEGAIQAADANWVAGGGGTVRKQPWKQQDAYRGAGRVIIKGHSESEASLGLDVRFEDDYDVEIYLSGTGTSSRATAIVDGNAVGQPLADSAGPLPIRKVSPGPIHLTEGKHAFGLRLTSGSSIALTALRLTPRSPLVHDFAVLGPFPARADVGVKTALEPDGKAPDLAKGYRSGGRTLQWTILRAPSGVLDLAAVFSPNENVVAYAAFAVKSPKDQTVPMMVGSDDGVEAWVNGKSVWTNHVARGFRLDEDRIATPLKQGWNTIVLKVENTTSIWEVSARLPDPNSALQFAAVAPVEG